MNIIRFVIEHEDFHNTQDGALDHIVKWLSVMNFSIVYYNRVGFLDHDPVYYDYEFVVQNNDAYNPRLKNKLDKFLKLEVFEKEIEVLKLSIEQLRIQDKSTKKNNINRLLGMRAGGIDGGFFYE